MVSLIQQKIKRSSPFSVESVTMSENLPYADIIILALIAGFILLRLRSVLGQKTGIDPSELFKPRPPKNSEEERTPLPGIVPSSMKNRDNRLPGLAEVLDPYMATLGEGVVSEAIGRIKSKDPLFTATSFLDGAKMAYEMVFDAFNKGDKGMLKLLLSADLADDFVADVDARSTQATITETTLLSVRPKEITRATLDSRNVAQIAVIFESEQVTVERDAKGNIVGGDPSAVAHAEDEWVFERDISSKNPNWKIIET
jgi:predicted lipid-binding transport protein (Tim44 family)